MLVNNAQAVLLFLFFHLPTCTPFSPRPVCQPHEASLKLHPTFNCIETLNPKACKDFFCCHQRRKCDARHQPTKDLSKRRRLVSTALGALGALGAADYYIAFHAKFAQNSMPMTANLKNLSKEPGDAR